LHSKSNYPKPRIDIKDIQIKTIANQEDKMIKETKIALEEFSNIKNKSTIKKNVHMSEDRKGNKTRNHMVHISTQTKPGKTKSISKVKSKQNFTIEELVPIMEEILTSLEDRLYSLNSSAFESMLEHQLNQSMSEFSPIIHQFFTMRVNKKRAEDKVISF
jgi:predicted site-specific integrase-resolvase